MAKDDGRIDLGYGTLNDVEEETFGPILDPRNSSGFNALRQSALATYRKNTLANSGPYRGIVLRVEANPSNNPITSWIQKINIFSKPRTTIKVRIPELHAAMLEPVNYGPNCSSANHIIDMYPSFVAEDDEVSNEVPAPGDIVLVDFSNRANMTGPIYKKLLVKNASGGAVGRETGRDMFANDEQAPLGVLPPLGDNPVSGLGNEENSIPGLVNLQPTRTSQTTVGSFIPQQEHVNTASGMPPMNLLETAYKNGQPIGNIELVEVPVPIATKSGIFIAKSQERNFYDLINAAKAAGIKLQLNSGFRSNDQQKYLYDGYKQGKPGFNLAAKPGTSNHQNGIAFDFATGGPNTKVYEWLGLNAHKFGFYNAGRLFKGQKEHWHWEFKGVNDATVVAEGKTPLSERLKAFA